MLESLHQGTGNIHQLNLDGAFPGSKVYRPREAYENLKSTPLYDAERGQWNWKMSEEQKLTDSDRNADAQLLGVLVEAKLLSTLPQSLIETIPPLPITEDW